MIESIVNYFTHISSLHRALILAGGITFFWLVEGGIPLFRFGYNKWKHASINIFFTITTILINFAFALVIVKASDWAVAYQFGLLQIRHPDDVHAPATIDVGLSLGRESRAFHAQISAPNFGDHASLLTGYMYCLHKAMAGGLRKADMGHQTLAEKCRHPAHGAVKKLIGNHESQRCMFLFQRTDRAYRDDALHAQGLEPVDVSAKV